MSLVHTTIDTPLGPLAVVASDHGLHEVRFPNGRPVGPADGPADPDDPVLSATVQQLAEYFDGSRQVFELPLAPQGSPFQLAAWHALRAIPYGETVTYGEQARRLGHAGKARAIGAANATNPIPVIVPCHRVIGADGSLTGFGGGLAAKAWLLHHERQVLGLELPL